MTEDALKELSLDQLCDLMVFAINEYLILHKMPGVGKSVEEKRDEINLINTAIREHKNILNPTH